MRFCQIVALVIAAFMSSTALAIDGYKDIKFGIKLEELKKAAQCSLEETTAEDDPPSVKSYMCLGFQFGNKEVLASFTFINNKLGRIGMVVGKDLAEWVNLFSGLKKKYGEPSTKLPIGFFENWDAGRINSGDIGFANEQITLRINRSDARSPVLVFLLYSHKNYGQELREAETAAVSDAL